MKAAPNFRSSSWSAIARGQRALACKPANVIVAVSPAPACNKPEPPGSLLSDPFGQKVRELLSAACNDVQDARLLSRRCYSCRTALVQRLSSLLQLLHGNGAASAITSLLRLLHSRSSDEERLKTCQMLSCCSCCTTHSYHNTCECLMSIR